MKFTEGPKSRDIVVVPRIAIQPKQPFANGIHRFLCQWEHTKRRIRSPKRMPFEHVLFYLNNFNVIVIIRFFGYFQNSASRILSTDGNISDKKCLIMLQLP